MFLETELLQMGPFLVIPEIFIFGGVWLLMGFLLWNPKRRDNGGGSDPTTKKPFPSFFIFKNKIF